MGMREVVELARSQHGVVHVGQLAGAGVSRRTLERQIERGWERLHPGVYALPGSAPSTGRAAAAALLAVGAHAALASWTAANLLGITAKRAWPVRVVVPHMAHHPRLRGVAVVRAKLLDDCDVTQWQGLRLTTPARTMCDLARDCDVPVLAELMATAVQEGLVTLDEVEAVRRRLGVRPGSGRLGQAVALLTRDGKTDSAAERALRRLLTRHGLRPAAGVYRLVLPDGTAVELDVAFPEHRVAIEVDGFRWHRTPEDLRRDHERQNGIQAAGWTLLRIGWREIRQPERFLAHLFRLLGLEDRRQM